MILFKVIAKEEEQFNKTIDQGLGILSDLIEEMEKSGESIVRRSGVQIV